MKEFLSQKRVLLDSIVMLIGTAAFTNSRELSLVKTNLQESIMFMGLMKKALGEENPYPESHNPKSPVIENRADKASAAYSMGGANYDEVSYVKNIRAELQEVIDQSEDEYYKAAETLSNIQDALPATSSDEEFKRIADQINNFYFANEQVKVSLTKAKLWLGMQLNFLREQKEYKQITGE